MGGVKIESMMENKDLSIFGCFPAQMGACVELDSQMVFDNQKDLSDFIFTKIITKGFKRIRPKKFNMVSRLHRMAKCVS